MERVSENQIMKLRHQTDEDRGVCQNRLATVLIPEIARDQGVNL
jgi:hypothetical protein